jgi:hypothetical protein
MAWRQKEKQRMCVWLVFFFTLRTTMQLPTPPPPPAGAQPPRPAVPPACPPFTIKYVESEGDDAATPITTAVLTVHLAAAFGDPPGSARAWAPGHLAVTVDAAAGAVDVRVIDPGVGGDEASAHPRPRTTLRARLARPAVLLLLPESSAAPSAVLDCARTTLTVAVPGLGGPAALAAVEAQAEARWGGGRAQEVVPDRTVVVP